MTQLIEWGTIPNRNEAAGGELPIVWVNGKPSGHRWAPVGCEPEEALRRAKARALETVEQYYSSRSVLMRPRKVDA